MKLINSEGTNKDNFSIGLGENKIDLKTINGQLFFRNFGGGYSLVASAATNNATVPREWAASTLFREGELVYFNGAVWFCITEHTSGVSFLATIENFVKIADVANFTNVDITSDDNPYQLDVFSSDFIYVEGTNASFVLKLPSALYLNTGRRYFIQNTSLSSIEIQDNSGNSLTTIGSGLAYTFSLLQNVSAAGSWSTYQITKESDTDLKVIVPTSGGSLAIGDIVYNNAGTWTLLDYYNKDKFNFGEIGIVREIKPAEHTILIGGKINFDDTPITLTANTDYYLSKTTPGLFSTTVSDFYLFKSNDTKNAIFLPSFKGERVRTRIAQTAHSLISGNATYLSGTSWVGADSSNRTNFAQGVVEVIDANNFYLNQLGLIELSADDWDAVKESGTGGLTPGVKYYLSSSTPGKITSVAPANTAQIVYEAISTTKAIILLSDQSKATTSTDGYLFATDWNIFNDKQNSLTYPNDTVSGAGALDNYDATDNSRLVFDSATSLSGIVARTGVTDSSIIITNTNTESLIITNDATSIEANRIITGTGKDLELKPQATIFLVYDTIASRWRIVGGSGAGGGGGGAGGLVYSPSVLTADLLAGQYNDWTLLLTDLVELAIPKVIFTESCSIPCGEYYDYDFEGASGLYYPYGYASGQIVLTFTGTSVNDCIPKKIVNLDLRLSSLTSNFDISSTNNVYTLINSILLFDAGLDVNCLGSTISYKFTLEDSRILNSENNDAIFISADTSNSLTIQASKGASLGDGLFSNFGAINVSIQGAFEAARTDEILFPVIGSVTKTSSSGDPIIFRGHTYPRIRKFYEIVTTAKTTFTLPIKGTTESVIVFVDGYPQFENFSVSGTTLTFTSNVDANQVVNGWVISI